MSIIYSLPPNFCQNRLVKQYNSKSYRKILLDYHFGNNILRMFMPQDTKVCIISSFYQVVPEYIVKYA